MNNKPLQIFLLVLIIIGIGLIIAQSLWVPPLVNWILAKEAPVSAVQKIYTNPSSTTTTTTVTNKKPPVPTPLPTPTPQATGTLSGTVTLSPTCPVEQIPPDPQCAPKPYVTTVRVIDVVSTNVVASIQTNPDGSFTFTLPPGMYDLKASIGTVYPRCSLVEAEVTASKNTVADISCDTGIR